MEEFTMFDVEKKYYYKEVEESASRYANLLSELNTYINSDGLKEQIELFSNIPWHRFSTKYGAPDKPCGVLCRC